MAKTVGDFFIERLHQWGVRRIYGYPGDGINGVFGALQRAEGKIEFVQARHEEMAAFMASAHAKFTGELGVCIATSGPGATHLVTGLYDARADHMPVLAIAGQQARTALGGHYQQEVDLAALFKDVAGAFVHTATMPAQVRHLTDRAVRIAIAERRVTTLIFPNDLQDLKYVEPPRAHGTLHSGIGYQAPKIIPYERELRQAADVLNAGKKVAILVGAGALNATDEVIAVADRLGAGVAKALLGKAVLPDDFPWVTGSIGLLGTEPSYKLMTECDTLLMIGSGFPYAEFLPEEGQARAVQIDIAPEMLSLRYPMEVNLVGDSAEDAACVAPAAARQDRPLLAQADRRLDAKMVENARRPGDAISQSDQPAAGRLGIVAATAGARDHHQRQRLVRELVCARPQNTPRHDVLAVGRPCFDGRRNPLRDRRQVCLSRSLGFRPGRRRRNADEQHG